MINVPSQLHSCTCRKRTLHISFKCFVAILNFIALMEIKQKNVLLRPFFFCANWKKLRGNVDRDTDVLQYKVKELVVKELGFRRDIS